MSKKEIRDKNILFAKRNGLEADYSHLPLLEDELQLKAPDLIAKRALCTHLVVASAFSPAVKKNSSTWLEKEKLGSYLTKREKNFLAGQYLDSSTFQWQQEEMYSFGWILGLIDTIEINKYVPMELAVKFPDLVTQEDSHFFFSSIKPRSESEVIQQLDLHYCLDWYFNSFGLITKQKLKINPLAISERRKSFEWCLTDVDWDDIPLDK